MFKWLTAFDFKVFAMVGPNHPKRQELERAIREFQEAAYGKALTAPLQTVDRTTATIPEIRNMVDEFIMEMRRLESLVSHKVYAIRTGEHDPLLFMDKGEEDVRLWALSHPDDKNLMYEEWVVKDPTQADAFRVVDRKALGIPTIMAKAGAFR
jgi:hypothetical protein